MRKLHDGLYAGSGTWWAFYEDEETYQDNQVQVILPYDHLSKEQRKQLNGPVKTYYLERTDEHVES